MNRLFLEYLARLHLPNGTIAPAIGIPVKVYRSRKTANF